MYNRSVSKGHSHIEKDFTCYTNDDLTDNDEISKSFELESNYEHLIYYNKFLIDGLGYFSTKDQNSLISNYVDAISYWNRHLATDRNNFDKLTSLLLLRSNLAVAYFLKSDIENAYKLLNECLENLERSSFKVELQKDNVKSLYIKVLCNLIVIFMVDNNIEGCNLIEDKLINFQSSIPVEQRGKLIRECIYIFFRHQTLIDLDNDYIDSIKSKIGFSQLGCFNMVIGLVKELKDDIQGALALYLDAYEIFYKNNDELFMLLIIRNILRIYKMSTPECEDYYYFLQIYNNLLTSPTYENIRIETLFENFDKRVEMCKNITVGICKLENNFIQENQNSAIHKSDKFHDSYYHQSTMEKMKRENKEIWKQAVRLNLYKAIKSSKEQLIGSKSRELIENQQNLLKIIDQLNITVSVFQEEQNDTVLERLFDDNYCAKSVTQVRAALFTIVDLSTHSAKKKGFEAIKEAYNDIKQSQLSHSRSMHSHKNHNSQIKRSNLVNLFPSRINNSIIPNSIGDVNPDSILADAIKTLLVGSKLKKQHYTTGGSKTQYFVIKKDASLRWANDRSDAQNNKSGHKYDLKDIRGIVYGHVTKTYSKRKDNKKLERWKCFSIIMKNRPFDVYCKDSHLITPWVYGLGSLVKMYNKTAYYLPIGKYLWRRLKFTLIHKVYWSLDKEKQKKLDKQGELTFCRSILLYNRIFLNLS